MDAGDQGGTELMPHLGVFAQQSEGAANGLDLGIGHGRCHTGIVVPRDEMFDVQRDKINQFFPKQFR